jgi:two-component system chemotaxis response regulator CheB
VAEYYGPDAVGVVLTGRLNDGTSGLFEIKRRGGTAIVQDPAGAEAPSMPQSALDNVPIDFCLPVDAIAGQLVRLTRERTRSPPDDGAKVMTEEKAFDSPIAQTCPECGGAMREESQGTLTRFRCHIGHVMTAEVLAATQLTGLESEIDSLLRSLNEAPTSVSG